MREWVPVPLCVHLSPPLGHLVSAPGHLGSPLGDLGSAVGGAFHDIKQQLYPLCLRSPLYPSWPPFLPNNGFWEKGGNRHRPFGCNRQSPWRLPPLFAYVCEERGKAPRGLSIASQMPGGAFPPFSQNPLLGRKGARRLEGRTEPEGLSCCRPWQGTPSGAAISAQRCQRHRAEGWKRIFSRLIFNQIKIS